MRRPILLVALALGLAACASSATPAPSVPSSTGPSPAAASAVPSTSPAGSPSGSPSGSPVAAGGLVFRVARAGGFIAPSAELATLPDVSIYDDGTVIVPGPASSADPAPAVPDVEVEHVSAAGLATIMAAARATGLADPTATFDGGPAPDAGVTLITIDIGGAVRHVRIVSLGDASRDDGLAARVVAARVKLRAFLAHLMDLPTLVGADLTAGPARYAATSLRLIVDAGAPGIGGGSTVAWPLSTPLSAFGAEVAAGGAGPATGATEVAGAAAGLNGGGGARCGVVSGSDLATLAPLLATASTATTWTSDGQPYTIVVRPLLPDETGCPGA